MLHRTVPIGVAVEGRIGRWEDCRTGLVGGGQGNAASCRTAESPDQSQTGSVVTRFLSKVAASRGALEREYGGWGLSPTGWPLDCVKLQTLLLSRALHSRIYLFPL